MHTNAVVHMFVSSLEAGGMGQSIVRIANQIHGLGGIRVRIYVREAPDVTPPPDLDRRTELVDLAKPIEYLRRPFKRADEATLALTPTQLSELYRATAVLLENAVRADIQRSPDSRHVLMSFYAVNQGFIAQLVANDLDLPHIACIRGTDFSRYFYNPFSISAFHFLCRNARWIVTTNDTQKQALERGFGRYDRISTIYSSVSTDTEARWEPSGRGFVRLVSDCGYSVKKGTNILLEAVEQLRAEGQDIRLSVVGSTDATMTDYWTRCRERLTAADPVGFTLGDAIPRAGVNAFILAGDVYASASLGEGSSNAIGRAMLLGMPIVATRTGSHRDMVDGARHVMLCSAGDPTEFKDAVAAMAGRIRSERFEVDGRAVEHWRALLDPDRESRAWQEVLLAAVGRSSPAIAHHRRPKLVFFVHDGTGLGHLHRVCRVARALQGRFSCLVITGHRAAAWLVPEECEFVHLPSLDSLDWHKARQWGRTPFVDTDRAGALRFRQTLINTTVEAFAPDAIIADYLPLGKNEELRPLIESSPARKYLILRGVLDTPENVATDILGGFAREAVERCYDRILVATDRRICDLAREYGFDDRIARKLSYVGYISTPISVQERDALRRERGISEGEIWVVCSANAGLMGARLHDECLRAPALLPEAWFDVIRGPRSRLPWNGVGDVLTDGRTRHFKECRYLSRLHASADIVVCGGGYNSLVEGMEGGARIVSCPVEQREDDEQHVHTARLARHYPVRPVHDPRMVPEAIVEEARHCRHGRRPAVRDILAFNGVEHVVEILSEDLGVVSASPIPSAVCV